MPHLSHLLGETRTINCILTHTVGLPLTGLEFLVFVIYLKSWIRDKAPCLPLQAVCSLYPAGWNTSSGLGPAPGPRSPLEEPAFPSQPAPAMPLKHCGDGWFTRVFSLQHTLSLLIIPDPITHQAPVNLLVLSPWADEVLFSLVFLKLRVNPF